MHVVRSCGGLIASAVSPWGAVVGPPCEIRMDYNGYCEPILLQRGVVFYNHVVIYIVFYMFFENDLKQNLFLHYFPYIF